MVQRGDTSNNSQLQYTQLINSTLFITPQAHCPGPALLTMNHPVWLLMKTAFASFLSSNRVKLFTGWGDLSPSRNFENILFCKQDSEASVLHLLAGTGFRGVLVCMNWDSQAQYHLPMQAPLYLTCQTEQSEHHVCGRSNMFSHCEVHQKAEEVPFSNAFRYLEMQISIKWWLPKDRTCSTVPGFTFFKKILPNFQVVTSICEQYLICQFLALELASSLDRLCKWKCVYPHAPPFPGRSVRLHYLQPSGKTGSHWWLLGTTFSGQFMVLTTKKEHRR